MVRQFIRFKKLILTVLVAASFLLPVAGSATEVYASVKSGEVLLASKEKPSGSNAENGWINHNDKNVYDSRTDSDDKNLKKKDSDVGWLEEHLSGLFASIADGIHWMLNGVGLDIDTIILGRISKNCGSVNYMGFEFAKGNPYGVVAAVVLWILRSVVLFAMGVQFLWLVSSSMWRTDRTKFKEGLEAFTICFVALFLIPYLLDLAIYLRDIFLKMLVSMAGENLGMKDSTLGIYSTFQKVYKAMPTFVNSFMMLGCSILGLWFAFSYVGVAVSMTLYVISIPIICVRGRKGKELLDRWMDGVLGNLMVPILDYTILLICVYIGSSASGFFDGGAKGQIVTLIICSMIIPARSVIQGLVGASSGVGAFLGAQGWMNLMAWGRTVKGVAGTVGNAVGRAGDRIGDVVSDRKNHRDEQELQAISNEEEQQAIEDYNNADSKYMESIDNEDALSGAENGMEELSPEEKMSAMRRENRNLNAEKAALNAENNRMTAENEQLDFNDEKAEQNRQKMAENQARISEIDKETAENAEEMSAMRGENRNLNAEKAALNAENNRMTAENEQLDFNDEKAEQNRQKMAENRARISEIDKEIAENAEKMQNLNSEDEGNLNKAKNLDDVYQGLSKSIENAEREVGLLVNDKASIQQENKDLDVEKTRLAAENAQLEAENAGLSRDDPRVADNKQRIAENRAQMATIDHQKADNASRMNELDQGIIDRKQAVNNMKQQQRDVEAIAERSGVSIAKTPAEAKDREIQRRRANMDNFDTPEFDGVLSHEERADFYRKRARTNTVRAAGSALGIAGAVGGSAVGFGMGTFMPSMVQATTTRFGANVGETAGRAVGATGAQAVNTALDAKEVIQTRIDRGELSGGRAVAATVAGTTAAVGAGIAAYAAMPLAAQYAAAAAAVTAGARVSGRVAAGSAQNYAQIGGLKNLQSGTDIDRIVHRLPDVPERRSRVSGTYTGPDRNERERRTSDAYDQYEKGVASTKGEKETRRETERYDNGYAPLGYEGATPMQLNVRKFFRYGKAENIRDMVRGPLDATVGAAVSGSEQIYSKELDRVFSREELSRFNGDRKKIRKYFIDEYRKQLEANPELTKEEIDEFLKGI